MVQRFSTGNDKTKANAPIYRVAVAAVVKGPTVLSQRYGRHLVRFVPKCLAMVVSVNSAPLLWISNGFLLLEEKLFIY